MFCQCAQTGTLTGGAKDETPPTLKIEESTPNQQVFFKKQRIELVFDEWIKLDKPGQQIVESPDIRGNLQTSLKGKTLRIDFPEEEELRDSTTYIINFGTAVKDLTEGNAVPNLRFVFSTGAYLDSLGLTGTIVDAITKEPVEDIYFMLYDNLSDTVFRKERPYYYASTDKNGQFVLENLKADTFQIFALKDKGVNYYFDEEDEQIGFSSQYIILNDSTKLNIQMQAFLEELRLRKPKLDINQYGVAKLIFKRNPYDAQVKYQDIGQKVIFETEKDTIKTWYQLPEYQTWDLYFQKDSVTIDTLTVKQQDTTKIKKPLKLKLHQAKSISQQIQHNPIKMMTIKFNHPIVKMDVNFIQILEDTIQTPIQTKLSLDSTAAYRDLKIEYAWKEAIPYQVKILPNGLTDIFGLTTDTIVLNYQIQERKNFGNLRLTVDSLKTEKHYVIQLLLKKELIKEFPVTGVSTWTKLFETIKPSTDYNVHIIRDRNGNGRWDTGNYDRKEQPELTFSSQLNELKPNWDVEATVVVPKE